MKVINIILSNFTQQAFNFRCKKIDTSRAQRYTQEFSNSRRKRGF